MITASAAILSNPEAGQCKIIGADKDIDTLMNESATADGMHQLLVVMQLQIFAVARQAPLLLLTKVQETSLRYEVYTPCS